MDYLQICPFCGKQPYSRVTVSRGLALDNIVINVGCMSCGIKQRTDVTRGGVKMGKLNDVLIRGIVDELSKKIKGGVRLSSLEKGMVINAMKKQSPYKPKEYEDKFYACKCGNVVLMKWEKYPDVLTPKSEGLPYCLACGQRLDWSEGDGTNGK